jgi:hypothetical protein
MDIFLTSVWHDTHNQITRKHTDKQALCVRVTSCAHVNAHEKCFMGVMTTAECALGAPNAQKLGLKHVGRQFTGNEVKVCVCVCECVFSHL